MNLFLGIACLVLGGLWLALSVFNIQSPLKPQITKADSRNQLFECYLLLHDHIDKVGTPQQKEALEVVLGAIVIQESQEA